MLSLKKRCFNTLVKWKIFFVKKIVHKNFHLRHVVVSNMPTSHTIAVNCLLSLISSPICIACSNYPLGNFDVTSDEEITLDGFLQLHEMTAADEEGGEEELWQVLRALGYDKQLQLNQVCTFVGLS